MGEMAFDLESLLKEVSSSSPTGENLEYDPSFALLERALAGKPEQQVGSALVPAEPPDWERVEGLGLDLLKRSKDLRIAVPLLRARANRAGMVGLTSALGLVRGLLDRYWPALHPQLDPDDATDATMRVSALSALCLPAALAEFRNAWLVRTRAFGAVSLRSLQDSSDPATPGAAFQEAGREEVSALVAALTTARDDVGAIEAAFAPVGTAPALEPLTSLFTQALALLEPYAAVVESAESDGNGVEGGGTVTALTPRGVGELTSREDVVRAIDQICKYYSRYEPSSPLPILLDRCRRLATMNFIDIVKDMAPAALSQVELLAGKTEK